MKGPKRVTFALEDQIYPPVCITPEPSDKEDSAIITPASDIDMSEFMKIALASPWNVLVPPAPKYKNTPAFADHGVISIRMDFKLALLPGYLELKVREGAPFISVGDIYQGINDYLNTLVKITDLAFSNQEPRAQEEIRSAFQVRTRHRFTGHVQYVDFLRGNKFLKGITVEHVLERWLAIFGPDEEDSPDTSPPADELIDISALAKWSPQLSSDEPPDTNTTGLYSDPRTLNLDRHGPVKRPALKSVQRLTSGINADTVSGIVENDKPEHLQTTTCWIAAEHALKHARSNMSTVSEIFDRLQIQKSEYAVYAGFDESLIKSGVGYIEQIHVFVSAEVDANSSLLAELGRLFSPFSSILFTGSSWYHMPVFKPGVNGDVWNFDELTYFTASKFADGGSSAKTPLTVISLSQSPRLADGPTGFSQGGDGKKNEERRPNKGKERDRGNNDEADKGDKNEDPDDDPGEPFGDRGGTIAGPANFFFEIVSKVYPIHDSLNAFQTLIMEGSMTIKTTPPVPQNPDLFSTRHIQLTGLTFGTEGSMEMAYKQFYVRVTIRSQHKNARVKFKSPKRTPESEREEKQTTSMKKGVTRGMEGGLTLGPRPQGAIKVAKTKTDEETVGFEKKRYTSRITEQHYDGFIWWGFYIDDLHEQERGIEFPDDALPAVCFEFVGDPKVPPPPPERMDLEIASYWSIIPKSEELESNWIRTFLNLPTSSGNTQAASYSNLCQITAFETVPSDLPPRSDYKATMHVRPGVPHTDYISCYTKIDIPTADSVIVTEEFTADDWRNLSTLKLKLSDYCRKTLENPGGDSKSH